MGGQRSERLSYQDAAFAYFDRDRFPYNVGSVGIYQGVIPFEDFFAHVERRLKRVRRYRQRLVPAPFSLAHPALQDDPDFDLENHLAAIELSEPGDDAQLARVAGEFFATPLDRGKPLWEVRLVRGLSGGRTAHIAKVHHCIVDGVGGVELLGALLDAKPTPAPEVVAEPDEPVGPLPGRVPSLIDAAFDQALEQIDNAEAVALGLVDPRSVVRWAGSVAKALWPVGRHVARPSGRTPWRTSLTTPGRMAWGVMPFSEAKAVSSALGGTINDVALTALAGGLGRYLELRGHETKGLVVRVLIPVNVRSKEEAHTLGNRVSFMLAGLPVDMADPVARFEVIHEEVASLKEGGQAAGLDKLVRALGRTPAPLQRLLGAGLRVPNVLADLVCTNVPGPLAPFSCLGHRLIDHYPWVPLGWRMGLGVAVMSYNTGLYFSLTADRSVPADLDRLAALVVDSFQELHRTIEKPRRSKVPARTRRRVAVQPSTDGAKPVAITTKRASRRATPPRTGRPQPR